MIQMSTKIPFKYIDRQINYPKIRTEVFNNMLSILKEYKIDNNKN